MEDKKEDNTENSPPPAPVQKEEEVEVEEEDEMEPDATSLSPTLKDGTSNKRQMVIRRTPRKRLIWTQELHNMFIDTVNRLGTKAVPTTILQEMNVEGLTRENIASHLQKYRLQLKKIQKLREGPKDHGGEIGVGGGYVVGDMQNGAVSQLSALQIPGGLKGGNIRAQIVDPEVTQATQQPAAQAYALPYHYPYVLQAQGGAAIAPQPTDGAAALPYVFPQYRAGTEPFYYMASYDQSPNGQYLAKLIPGTTIIPVSQLVTTATTTPTTPQVTTQHPIQPAQVTQVQAHTVGFNSST